MLNCFATSDHSPIIPIEHIDAGDFETWQKNADPFVVSWLKSSDFQLSRGDVRLVPNAEGHLARVIVGVKRTEDPWSFANLSLLLPEGHYRFTTLQDTQRLTRAAVAWGLGAYQYTKYKKEKRTPAKLIIDSKCDEEFISHYVKAVWLVRDLVNTPTEDLGPSELSQFVANFCEEWGAQFTEIVGDDLLKANHPTIHAVGRACDDPPRLLDFTWGDSAHPKLTLVGKGVCFDTGGLNMKTTAGMTLMKKDMGGAAHVLGLAYMVMALQLPVRLRVMIPAVENSISDNAIRPGDVIKTRSGKTVEITNTDAEGRLVLCDAMAAACEESPDLVIDFATLTGAARVALGTEIPALFVEDDKLNDELMKAVDAQDDCIWRLPLHAPYRSYLDSRIADICNSASSGYGGAITAALYLKEFIPKGIAWMHLDVMAWNIKTRKGRPIGGEAMGLRAMLHFLVARYRETNMH